MGLLSINYADFARHQQLSISSDDVEEILVSLILDGRIKGQIDQVTGKLELDQQYVVPSVVFLTNFYTC